MAAIGSLTISAWRGTMQGEQKPVEVITRPGVAGTGALVGAYASVPSTIETDYYGTIAQVDTWRDTALGYVGTSQSVTDSVGATWPDCLIEGMTYSTFRAKGLGGSNTHVIRATWQMRAEY